MNEKTKNILKIIGIWFGVNLILTFLWWYFFERTDFKSVLENFLILVASPIGFCILFSPAIIALYFLFKKIQNKNLRILLTAFLIPFNNLIYLAIGHFFYNDLEALSILGGFASLFMILPIALVVTFCIPKSLLSFKKEAIFTNILMWFFGWGLIFIALTVGDCIDKRVEAIRLSKYEPIIQQLEEYKSQNGVYPESIKDSVKAYKEFSYKPQDEGKDFVLNVGNHWTMSYYYCSNDEYYYCKKGWHDGGNYTKLGKWTKADYSD